MALFDIIFWVSLFLVLHTYAVYPLLLNILPRYSTEEGYRAADELPTVSIIFSAYNEEGTILDKTGNCLALDYPEDRIEVIVGSDGSDDRTVEKLETVDDTRLRIFEFEGRHGKSWVLNRLVTESKSEILVFTDANVLFAPDALKRLVERFGNETVGGVCGKMNISMEESAHTAEMTYWSLENIIKRNEARIQTLFGATGAIYAIRRRLFREIPVDPPVVDDFIVPIFVVKQGFRIVYAEDAIAYEKAVDDPILEFKRRIRIGAHSFNGIRYYRSLLNPARGFIAFGLWSHKIVRWFVPMLLIAAFISSLILAGTPLYRWIITGELILLTGALAGLVLYLLNIRIKLLSYLTYALLLNAGLFLGFLKFLTGSQRGYWESTKRPS